MNRILQTTVVSAMLGFMAFSAMAKETTPSHTECAAAYQLVNSLLTQIPDSNKQLLTKEQTSAAAENFKKRHSEELTKAIKDLGEERVAKAFLTYRTQLEKEVQDSGSTQPATDKVDSCEKLNTK